MSGVVVEGTGGELGKGVGVVDVGLGGLGRVSVVDSGGEMVDGPATFFDKISYSDSTQLRWPRRWANPSSMNLAFSKTFTLVPLGAFVPGFDRSLISFVLLTNSAMLRRCIGFGGGGGTGACGSVGFEFDAIDVSDADDDIPVCWSPPTIIARGGAVLSTH